MTPEIETYSQYIREKITEIHAALAGLTNEDLNRAPELSGANSPFVIATHTFGNIRAWVLGIVCGQDLSRDRPAEFACLGSYEELGVASCNLSGEVEAALQGLDPLTLDDRFVPSRKLWGEGEPREITRRAGLVHVLEHAGIHLGHIHMTVELLRRAV
jgi:hypothetical protein